VCPKELDPFIILTEESFETDRPSAETAYTILTQHHVTETQQDAICDMHFAHY